MFPQELTEQSAYASLFIDISLNRQKIPISAPLSILSIYFKHSEFLYVHVCLHAISCSKAFFFQLYISKTSYISLIRDYC